MCIYVHAKMALLTMFSSVAWEQWPYLLIFLDFLIIVGEYFENTSVQILN